uniref:Uncharacterized protein n=1 Tax=Ignavibacterium album TaxID=591197 RepID=A0A7V3E8H7_9BACT
MNIDLSIKIIQPLSSRIKSHTGKLKRIKIIGGKMKRAIILTIVSMFLFISFSCKENGITPPEDKPGRRDYMWTVDTIGASNNTYYRLWASSPTDVWATSPGDLSKSIAHFDGARWITYYVPGMNTLHSIYGFAYNNIYIAARGGGIWKFDGANWTKFAHLSVDGQTDIAFSNIWGESSNDFYAFGGYPDTNRYYNNSFIAYYNNNWMILDTKGSNGIVGKLFKNSWDDKIYILTLKAGNGLFPDSTIIYEYDQSNFKKIYSSIWTGGQQADISLINNEVYFILGYQLAKRVNGQFQTFLQVNNLNFYQRIWGRNSKDIFLLMIDGLAHYNGSDIQYLFHFNKVPRTQIYGAALFDKDAFFLVYESQTGLSLIYHGKLK